MEIKVVAGDAGAARGADALIVTVPEGGSADAAGAGTEAVRAAMGGGDFTGKTGEVLVVYPGGEGPRRLIAVGLGQAGGATAECVRRAIGRGVRRARDLGAHDVAALLVEGTSLQPAQAAEAMAEAAILADYDFGKYHTLDAEERGRKHVDRFTVVAPQGGDTAAIEAGARAGQAIGESANFARDLVTAPGNELTPTAMAEAARRMAAEVGVRCTVLGRDEMREHRMGALLAVVQGSAEPPAFIILEYTPENAASDDTLIFVGKGITFDTGGISIKPSEGMWHMKHDMAGAAAAIGAVRAVAALKLPVKAVGLVAATENMPSGTAFRPGDVLTTMAGITIEIHSTDAEGRLVLSDALHWAKRYRPAAVVDLATLTGSCVVALGNEATGGFTNDEALLNRLVAAGKEVGERVWPLPLWPEYDEAIKSDIADVKNTGGRPGGAITAAALLKKFVDYPWVHLDIAGTAWTEKAKPYTPKGATGVGVRLLAQLARDWQPTGASTSAGSSGGTSSAAQTPGG